MPPAPSASSEPPSAAISAGHGNLETNMVIFENFAKDMATIIGHPVFKNIVDAKPLGISKSKDGGGNQVAYAAELFETAMKSTASYKCGGNLFWLDHAYNPSSGTPLSIQRIKDLKEFSFSKPSAYPLDVIIAVPHDKFNPMEHLGALQSVSPIEVLIAFAQAVAESIRSEQPEATLKEWKISALTCTMVFEVLASNEQILARSLGIREKISSDFASLSRTPFQRVYEIWHYKQRKEEQNGGPMTSKKLADDFNSLVKLAKTSEPVVTDYVTACIMVYEKAFKYPEVQQSVAWCDEKFGTKSPFDSVYKMQAILRKCKDKREKVIWIFQAIIDQLKAGVVKVKDLTMTLLFGAQGRSGGGWVDMWIMKHDLLYYLTKTSTVQKFCFSVEHLSQIDQVLQSFTDYRALLNPHPANKWKNQDEYVSDPAGESVESIKPADLTWQSGWSAAALQYINFCEDLVYGNEFDPFLKTACRGSKSALDVFDYPTIQARLTEMKVLRDKELDKDLELEKLSKDGGGEPAAKADDEKKAEKTSAAGDKDDEEDADAEKEKREVERMLQRGVTLFVEPSSQSELKEALLASRFKDIKGDTDKAYVLIIYDYKQASESQTRPQTRIAPLRDTRMKSMIQATLDARRSVRSEASCIMPGDVAFFDGSRAGHHYMFNNKVFVDEESGAPLAKVSRQLRIEYLESAVAERRSYCRKAVASLKSNETAYIITNDFVRLPQKKKKHFSGTNLGSSLVDVPLASAKETWQMTREAKKDLYGKYLVPVGGKDSDGEDDEAEMMMDETPTKAKQQKLDPKEEVPVFYWQPSGLLCEELLHMYSISAIIDLTAGSGQWALAALKNNLPYFGVVLTPTHQTSLREWLLTSVLKGQHDETSPFFQRSLRKKADPPKPPTEPKKKPKKPKKEEKKKKKKSKKSYSSSFDSSASVKSESDSPL